MNIFNSPRRLSRIGLLFIPLLALTMLPMHPVTVKGEPLDPICGDVNNDGRVNIADLNFLIDYNFRGGPVPSPYYIGDVDGSDMVNVIDALYLFNAIFMEGPLPNCPPPPAPEGNPEGGE